MAAIREARKLPIPELAEKALQAEKAIDNGMRRMARQETMRGSAVAAAKERERLSAFNLKPLPWDPPAVRPPLELRNKLTPFRRRRSKRRARATCNPSPLTERWH